MSHLDSETIALIALGESSTQEYLDHVRTCVACQSELDELAAVVTTASSINDSDRPVAAPAFIWDNIERELALSAEQPIAGSSAQLSDLLLDSDVTARPRKNRAMFALAASAGILFGGLGTYVALEARGGEPTPTLVAEASLDPLRDVEQPALARVEQVDGRDVLNVQASGLPATDGFYEVWLLAPDASSMISVGMLDASEGGRFPLPAGLDLAAFPVVDISLEHFDGDTTHSTDSILRGKLEI